ncbi:MAG: ABC transporter permease [Acidobacteria bacterium]|nr:ABC transporter permease [Acidobacteriota bacterium]
MGSLLQNFRYAWRVFARSPGLTAVAVLSLALGIGANTAIFSVVDGLFLRPLPVKDPDRLAWVYNRTAEGLADHLAYADYLDFRDQSTSFSGFAAQSRRGALLNVNGESELVLLTVVSDNYFSVLGVSAALGRTFSPELDQNLAREPAVVISHGLWQRRFGGNPELIGKTIELNGQSYTVVGIAPQRFRGLMRWLSNDVWVSTRTWVAMGPRNRTELEQRDSRAFEILGRLRPGVRIEQAQAQLETIAHRLEQAYPATNQGRGIALLSTAEESRGGIRLSLLVMSIVGLVLLIACANVANLLLAQAETRRREIAIRLALGAGRRRLISQLLAESLLLSLMAGALGVLLATWLIDATPALMPPSPFPMSFDIRLEQRVLIFTLFLSLLTALLFGLAPAVKASKPDLVAALKGEEGYFSREMRRFALRNVLVVGQIALSVVLVSAAGLLLRSFLFSLQIRPGFDPKKNMLLVWVVPLQAASGMEQLTTRYQELLERIRALPGVKQASLARRMLLSGSGGGAEKKVRIPGVELPRGQDSLSIKYNEVALNYFGTMGARILRGRDFDPYDGPTGQKVVLVGETMARRFWPGSADPVGRFLYFPFAQMPSREATFLVEAAGDVALLADAVKHEVRSAGGHVSIVSMMTLKQHMQFALYADWAAAVVVGSLSVLGIFLAAVGLYGVASYAVNRRTHEIGVRMALGAERGDVLHLVLGQGLKLALAGLPIGLAAALVVARLMSGVLYGVRPADPLTFAGSCLLVVVVVLAATHFPARRATKVDPAVALRYE